MPDYIVKDSILRADDKRYRAGETITLDRETGERLVKSGAVAAKPGRPTGSASEPEAKSESERKPKS